MHFQLYLYSILAFSLFILVEILTRKYSIQLNSVVFVFRRSVLTLLFSMAWFFASNSNNNYFNLSTSTIYHLLLCAILMGIGLISFVESNKHLALTNILSIQMLGIILKLVLDSTVTFQSTGFLGVFGVFLSVFGLFLLLSLPENRIGVFWALMSSLSWCMGYELIFESINKLGAPLTVVLIDAMLLISTLIILLYRKRSNEVLRVLTNLNSPIVIIAMLNTIGILVLAYGSKLYDIEIVSVLNICLYPISIIMVRYLFNELVVVKEWIGILCIFIAVLLLYLFL